MYKLVLLFLHGFLTDSCNGCSTGTFSLNNECRQCPENCSSCDSETTCISCKIGYHGETCSLACNQHCHDNECEKTSGTCLSCMKGYYSSENKTCIKCPKSCVTCRSSSYCFACKSGYRGDFCDITCSNCKEETSCDKNTGYCLNSCTDGLSGELCDTNCNVKCKSCVRRNHNECTACAFDKYGIYCNKNCSSTCIKNECDESNGGCTSGCLVGYWGPMCENLCSANCKNFRCTRQDGSCLEGCTERFYYYNCSKAHLKAQSGHFQYILGPIIAVVVVILIVFVFVCYKKRWYSQTPCKKPKIAEDTEKALVKLSDSKITITFEEKSSEIDPASENNITQTSASKNNMEKTDPDSISIYSRTDSTNENDEG